MRSPSVNHVSVSWRDISIRERNQHVASHRNRRQRCCVSAQRSESADHSSHIARTTNSRAARRSEAVIYIPPCAIWIIKPNISRSWQIVLDSPRAYWLRQASQRRVIRRSDNKWRARQSATRLRNQNSQAAAQRVYPRRHVQNNSNRRAVADRSRSASFHVVNRRLFSIARRRVR